MVYGIPRVEFMAERRDICGKVGVEGMGGSVEADVRVRVRV